MRIKRGKMIGKKSQVSLWIIIAVVLLAIIALFFILREKINIPGITPSILEPQAYIEKCVKDASFQAIDIMLPQGGYLNPGNYKLYKNNKVAYLCYNSNYYLPCENQEPMYIETLKQEIKSYITPKLKDCFYALEQEYKKRNYQVLSGDLSLEINLNPKQVNIEINRKLTLTKNEETKKYEEFKAKVSSPIYDLGVIAQEIINQETKFCYFEYLGFSLLYPEFNIEKTDLGGETKIYSIEEKFSGKKLNFAVRSCAMPAGM